MTPRIPDPLLRVWLLAFAMLLALALGNAAHAANLIDVIKHNDVASPPPKVEPNCAIPPAVDLVCSFLPHDAGEPVVQAVCVDRHMNRYLIVLGKRKS